MVAQLTELERDKETWDESMDDKVNLTGMWSPIVLVMTFNLYSLIYCILLRFLGAILE